MIYTLTMNPTLDITYVVNEIDFGEPVRALEVVKTPGGKGINVSRALRAMGTIRSRWAWSGGTWAKRSSTYCAKRVSSCR